MPPAIPIVVAVAVKAAGFSLAVAAIASLVTSFVVSALTSKKPKTPNFDFGFRSSSSGRTQTVRQPISPQTVVYGQARVGGVLTFIESASAAGKANLNLHMVITLGSGGPYEEIGDVYINETRITDSQIDPDGSVNSGRYQNYARIKKHLGGHDQVADPDLVAETSIDSNFRGQGICYLYVRLQWNVQVYNGIPNISAVVKGRKIHDMRGSPSQDPDNPDEWQYSNNAILCAYDYTRGVPHKRGDGTVVRRFGLNAADTSIDSENVSDLATICDQDVPLAGSPLQTEKRYTSNGVVETQREPYAILNDMRTSFAGDVIYTSGQWSYTVGQYLTPTVTLTEDDLMGPPTIRPHLPRRELFNAVKGVFVSPDNSWQPTDYPPLTSSTYEAEDNNRRIWADFDLPFTTSSSTAQRLAKLNLEGARRQVSVDLLCKLTAFQVKTGDTIALTLERFGWTEKSFYVTNWEMVDDSSGGGKYLGVNLSLREIDSTVFDWSAEETAMTPPASPTLPDPFNVAPPTSLVITSGNDELFLRADGTVFTRMKVAWTAPADEFVTSGGRIEIFYKQSSSASWDKWGNVPGDETFVHILDVNDGISYDVAARSANSLGVYSDTDADPNNWSASDMHTVAGKSAAPSDVDTFNVSRLPDGTRRFVWTHSPVPVDVRTGGGYQIKYVAGAGGVWGSMTDLHEGLWLVSPYETNELAAGTYTFGIKAVDSSGNESENATIIEATLGDPRLRNVLVSQNEFDLGWSGTKTNCFVNYEGFLESVGATSGSPQGDWGSLPATWDDLADTWREIVTSESSETSMVYVTPEIDVGSNVTFNPLVSTSGVGSVTVEMQRGTDADGSAEGSPDDDNAWEALGIAEATRYIRFRLTVTGDAAILYSATTLLDAETQIEDYEDLNTSSSTIDEFESLATGHFRVRTRGNTASITSAQITAFQSAGSGWTWEVLSKNTTLSGSPNDDFPAAEFKIYQNGVLADATVDVSIKGTKI